MYFATSNVIIELLKRVHMGLCTGSACAPSLSYILSPRPDLERKGDGVAPQMKEMRPGYHC